MANEKTTEDYLESPRGLRTLFNYNTNFHYEALPWVVRTWIRKLKETKYQIIKAKQTEIFI